jgi:hypothetical protein
MSDVSENQLHIDNDERDRGILTQPGRAFVRGEKEYAHRQTKYERKQTIENRLKNALLDLLLLADHADDALLDEITDGVVNDDQLEDGLAGALGFVFRISAREDFAETPAYGGKSEKFEEVLERAIREMYFKYDYIVDDFSLDIKSTHAPNAAALKKKARSGEELSPALIHYALTHDMVETDTIEDVVREQLKDLPDEG